MVVTLTCLKCGARVARDVDAAWEFGEPDPMIHQAPIAQVMCGARSWPHTWPADDPRAPDADATHCPICGKPLTRFTDKCGGLLD